MDPGNKCRDDIVFVLIKQANLSATLPLRKGAESRLGRGRGASRHPPK